MSSALLPLVLAGLLLAPPAKVYVCQGSASYAYHATDRCEGLAWCTKTVAKLPRAQAEKLGRRPCGRCYRR
ncbi:hypothetical protein [Hymenobacter jeollabukensis]|uniref:Nuclease n=1 Tax=Hymenobacter jeollabukensis TaxID=2025313 RepID=A0A5R8WII6_9BACT|nr:hypothetical protein [Hymenobacter jeollabukensis]TLM88686.1 hypothetical protein FDY95_22895 [Hymenobacter jeollabukensis]